VDQAWSTFDTDADLLDVLGKANEQRLFSDPEDRTVRTTEEALKALYQGIGLCPTKHVTQFNLGWQF
jgi:hypothetical protein